MRESQENHGNGSFVFGLVLGAVIGAVIAIIIYRNNKNQILSELQFKLQEFFNQFTNPDPSQSQTKKKPVFIPDNVPIIDLTPPKSNNKPKKFIRK